MMRMLLVAALFASCARRVCGTLSADEVLQFHASHAESVTANASSVEDLALERWRVCIENGAAQFQNHPTVWEIENQYGQLLDGGAP